MSCVVKSLQGYTAMLTIIDWKQGKYLPLQQQVNLCLLRLFKHSWSGIRLQMAELDSLGPIKVMNWHDLQNFAKSFSPKIAFWSQQDRMLRLRMALRRNQTTPLYPWLEDCCIYQDFLLNSGRIPYYTLSTYTTDQFTLRLAWLHRKPENRRVRLCGSDVR